MKTKILIIAFLLIANLTNSQIFNWGQGNTKSDVPAGSYIKDVNNDFNKFAGTWKYTNGTEILTIVITKAEHILDTEYNVYQDYLVGEYSYTTDGGATYIVNTIAQNLGIIDKRFNSTYSSGYDDQTSVTYAFRDVVYNKDSRANTTFVANGLQNQMVLKLINIGRGYILPDVPPSPNFCIPNNVVLIKQ